MLRIGTSRAIRTPGGGIGHGAHFPSGKSYVVWEDTFADAQAAGSVDGTTVPNAYVGGVAVVRGM